MISIFFFKLFNFYSSLSSPFLFFLPWRSIAILSLETQRNFSSAKPFLFPHLKHKEEWPPLLIPRPLVSLIIFSFHQEAPSARPPLEGFPAHLLCTYMAAQTSFPKSLCLSVTKPTAAAESWLKAVPAQLLLFIHLLGKAFLPDLRPHWEEVGRTFYKIQFNLTLMRKSSPHFLDIIKHPSLV